MTTEEYIVYLTEAIEVAARKLADKQVADAVLVRAGEIIRILSPENDELYLDTAPDPDAGGGTGGTL